MGMYAHDVVIAVAPVWVDPVSISAFCTAIQSFVYWNLEFERDVSILDHDKPYADVSAQPRCYRDENVPS